MVLLLSPGWHQTCNSFASASQVLGIQEWVIVPSSGDIFLIKNGKTEIKRYVKLMCVKIKQKENLLERWENKLHHR
jgi:hypothetical protein